MFNNRQYSTENNSPLNRSVFYDQSTTTEAISPWGTVLDLNDSSACNNIDGGGNLVHSSSNSPSLPVLFDGCGSSSSDGMRDHAVVNNNYQRPKLCSSFLEEKKLQLFIPSRESSTDQITNHTTCSPSVSNPNTPTTPNSALLRHLPPSQPRSLLQIHFKNNSFSNVVSQKSTALKSKLRQHGDYKQSPDTNSSVRYYSSHTLPPSYNTFILPPPYEEKSNFSVSTCNLRPHPFMSSSYSQSSNTSSPKVDSPSLLYSNSSIIKPFTYNFIKQKAQNKCQDTKVNSSLNNEELKRLELFYKKSSEISSTQLIPKLDLFYKVLLSQIQEILLRLVQVKTEESDSIRLSRIQHLLLVKQYILSCSNELENYSLFLNIPSFTKSEDDLKYLGQIERILNHFKVFISSGEDHSKTLNPNFKVQHFTDDQIFQYMTQLSVSFCICCGKPVPHTLQKCMQYFSAKQLTHEDLLKKLKHEDQTQFNKFLTLTNNLSLHKKDMEDETSIQEMFNTEPFEND